MCRFITCASWLLIILLASLGRADDDRSLPWLKTDSPEELAHRLEVYYLYPGVDKSERVADELVRRGPATVPALVEAFRRWPNYVTARVLGRIGDARAVGPLIAALHDRHATVRAAAAQSLGKLRDARAVEPLIACLDDHQAAPRAAAAEALGQLRDGRAVKPLVAMQAKRAEPAATLALARFLDRRALGRLVAIARDKKADEEVRGEACLAIAAFRNSDSLDVLLELFRDRRENRSVRADAAEAVGRTGGARAAAALIDLAASLHHDPSDEGLGMDPRAGCPGPDPLPPGLIRGLVAAGRPAAEPLMAALEKHKEASYIFLAALGELGDPRAAKPVIRMLPHDFANASAALAKLGPAAVEPLIAALDDPDGEVRSGAARALALGTDRRAADPLWARLKNPRNEKDEAARQAAIEFLAKIRDPRLFDLLAAQLGHRDVQRVRQAAAGLGQLGDLRAVTPLVAAMKVSDREVRASAIAALEHVGTPAAADAIAAWIKSDDESIQLCAGMSLARLGDARGVGPLVETIRKQPGTGEAAHYEKALVKLGPAAVEPLVAAMGDADMQIRMMAATTLGEIGDRRAVEPLIARLLKKDEQWWARLRVAGALGALGDARAVAPLIQAWKFRDGIERAAQDALWMIGTPAVVPLCEALKDPDPAIGDLAAAPLMRIADRRAVEPLLEYHRRTKWPNVALRALITTGDPQATKLLVEALRDRATVMTAIETLPWLGAPAVEPVIAVLKDHDPSVRRAAALVLGRLGDPRAVEPLLPLLGDQDKSVRATTAQALGSIDDPRAVDALLARLKDDDREVRISAALSLGAVGDPRAEEPLREQLASERDEDAREAISEAVGQLQ